MILSLILMFILSSFTSNHQCPVSVNAALADITGDEGVFHGIDGVIPAEYPSCEATETTSAPGPTAAPVAAPAASESSAHPIKASFLAVTLVGAVMSIVL